MRFLNWLLHAGGGFVVGFYGGLAILVGWLAWEGKRQEDYDFLHSGEWHHAD